MACLVCYTQVSTSFARMWKRWRALNQISTGESAGSLSAQFFCWSVLLRLLLFVWASACMYRLWNGLPVIHVSNARVSVCLLGISRLKIIGVINMLLSADKGFDSLSTTDYSASVKCSSLHVKSVIVFFFLFIGVIHLFAVVTIVWLGCNAVLSFLNQLFNAFINLSVQFIPLKGVSCFKGIE